VRQAEQLVCSGRGAGAFACQLHGSTWMSSFGMPAGSRWRLNTRVAKLGCASRDAKGPRQWPKSRPRRQRPERCQSGHPGLRGDDRAGRSLASSPGLPRPPARGPRPHVRGAELTPASPMQSGFAYVVCYGQTLARVIPPLVHIVSVGSVAGKHAGDGLQQDLPIERQRPIVDVLHVQLHPSVEIDVVTA
jgi:hypothetical protein